MYKFSQRKLDHLHDQVYLKCITNKVLMRSTVTSKKNNKNNSNVNRDFPFQIDHRVEIEAVDPDLSIIYLTI